MMTAAERLKSIRSNHLFSGTKIQQQAFGRILIFFDNGDLENTNGKRAKNRKFADIEDKLSSYTKLRARKYKQEKYVASWLLLREKCVKWAVNLEIENFKCSDGWISDTLRRHGIKKFNIHGKKNDMTE